MLYKAIVVSLSCLLFCFSSIVWKQMLIVTRMDREIHQLLLIGISLNLLGLAN